MTKWIFASEHLILFYQHILHSRRWYRADNWNYKQQSLWYHVHLHPNSKAHSKNIYFMFWQQLTKWVLPSTLMLPIKKFFLTSFFLVGREFLSRVIQRGVYKAEWYHRFLWTAKHKKISTTILNVFYEIIFFKHNGTFSVDDF